MTQILIKIPEVFALGNFNLIDCGSRLKAIRQLPPQWEEPTNR